jgi:hypothetical protein
MLHQVDDASTGAMSGIELSRVRTELRLLPHEPINQSLLVSREPTLLCNQADSSTQVSGDGPGYPTHTDLHWVLYEADRWTACLENTGVSIVPPT